LGTAHNDYVMPDPVSYCEEINKSAVVICQIESETGVRNAEAIAAVEGVDVLWVGHYDMTVSMGIAGQFQHERFLSALRSTVAAGKAHGRALGIQPGNPEQAQQWRSLGFNVISWGADISVYRGALQAAIARLRSEAAGL
jgi:2-dehydro-3-deoxyglucarate aldolase/4-hydroxy-2-oxoheptanedioate aldolase